jgi:hypothetical protein
VVGPLDLEEKGSGPRHLDLFRVGLFTMPRDRAGKEVLPESFEVVFEGGSEAA